MRHLLSFFLLAFLAATVHAQQTGNVAPMVVSNNLPLETVKWAGAPVTMENLKGKSVAVLVYATWCPKCNEWSGERLEAAKSAIADKPAVILAINVDDDASEMQKYMTERKFIAPNIIHGHDPSMVKKLGLESDLFRYVALSPDGAIIEKNGYLGASNPGNVVAAAGGSFKIMVPGLSLNAQNLMWPLELGMMNDFEFTRNRNTLAKEEGAELDGVIGKMLDAKLAEVKDGYKSEDLTKRFVAYDRAQETASMFKSMPQNKTARDAMIFMERDEVFKKELAARKAYENTMQKPAAARKNLLRAVATRFEGTHYGKLAKDAVQ